MPQPNPQPTTDLPGGRPLEPPAPSTHPTPPVQPTPPPKTDPPDQPEK
jgi:hypothetical protein